MIPRRRDRENRLAEELLVIRQEPATNRPIRLEKQGIVSTDLVAKPATKIAVQRPKKKNKTIDTLSNLPEQNIKNLNTTGVCYLTTKKTHSCDTRQFPNPNNCSHITMSKKQSGIENPSNHLTAKLAS